MKNAGFRPLIYGSKPPKMKVLGSPGEDRCLDPQRAFCLRRSFWGVQKADPHVFRIFPLPYMARLMAKTPVGANLRVLGRAQITFQNLEMSAIC